MDNRLQKLISILQIVVGILAGIVFIKNIFDSGETGMFFTSLILMILGLKQGITGICNKKKK